MSNFGMHIISFLGVVSVISLLIAMILLFNMIQQAFSSAGVVWGLIATVYPPGTYLYCRRNWDKVGSRFMLVSGLIVTSLVFWMVVKFIAV